MADFWDKESAPITINKNDRGDVIQIKRVVKSGKEFTDVRSWYVDRQSGELKPGKGIAIPEDLADEVSQAILDIASAKYL